MFFLPPDVFPALRLSAASPPDFAAVAQRMGTKNPALAVKALEEGYEDARNGVSYADAPGGRWDRFWRAGFYLWAWRNAPELVRAGHASAFLPEIS